MYEDLKRRIIKKMAYDTPALSKSEERYVVTWKEEYKLKDVIVMEAFTRALAMKGKNITFAYIDAILKDWSKKGVKNYTDILNIDEEYRKNKYSKKNSDIKKNEESEKLKVRYFSDKLEKIRFEEKEWTVLRIAEDISLKKGECHCVSLGVSFDVPEGYEMFIIPRSTTFKHFGVIQANSVTVISGKSAEEAISIPIIAVRDTELRINNRLFMFRLFKCQNDVLFEEKDK